MTNEELEELERVELRFLQAMKKISACIEVQQASAKASPYLIVALRAERARVKELEHRLEIDRCYEPGAGSLDGGNHGAV